MAVGTGIIDLTDITTEIYGDIAEGRGLVSCFASATDGTFDATYEGSKDRLSNFKGYVHTARASWGVDKMTVQYENEYLC